MPLLIVYGAVQLLLDSHMLSCQHRRRNKLTSSCPQQLPIGCCLYGLSSTEVCLDLCVMRRELHELGEQGGTFFFFCPVFLLPFSPTLSNLSLPRPSSPMLSSLPHWTSSFLRTNFHLARARLHLVPHNPCLGACLSQCVDLCLVVPLH